MPFAPCMRGLVQAKQCNLEKLKRWEITRKPPASLIACPTGMCRPFERNGDAISGRVMTRVSLVDHLTVVCHSLNP